MFAQNLLKVNHLCYVFFVGCKSHIFISKDTFISGIVQCIHYETRKVVCKIFAKGRDYRIFNLLERYFNWFNGVLGVFDDVIIHKKSVVLHDHNCRITHLQFHIQRSFQNHKYQFVVLVWINLRWLYRFLYREHTQCWWMNLFDFLGFSIGHNDICFCICGIEICNVRGF